ncbi:hypothetical protein LCGC14_2511910, partial [marine sediment metagenome]
LSAPPTEGPTGPDDVPPIGSLASAPDMGPDAPVPEEPADFAVGARSEERPEAPPPDDQDGEGERPLDEAPPPAELRPMEQLEREAQAMLGRVVGSDGADADPDAVFETRHLLLLVEIQRRKRRLFQQVWRSLGSAKPRVPMQDLRKAMGDAAPRRRDDGGDDGGGHSRG